MDGPLKRLVPTDRASSRGAFTILELLVLLAVLSAVASLGIPAYFSRPAVTLDSAAKLLAKDLREVQNRAALYEEALMIRFDEDGHGYAATICAGEITFLDGEPTGARPGGLVRGRR